MGGSGCGLGKDKDLIESGHMSPRIVELNLAENGWLMDCALSDNAASSARNGGS